MRIEDQPNWGLGHIRSGDQLKENTVYLYHTEILGVIGNGQTFITSTPTHRVAFLELPQQGQQSVLIRIDNGHRAEARHLSLAELGLMPFPDGTWSRWNWLQEPKIQNRHNKVNQALILSCH